TLWNSVKFFVDYANVASFEPQPGSTESSHALDRWLYARTDQMVAEMQSAYERFWTPDATRSFTAFVDDLSNWYIRRSRRRFWDEDAEALQALWNALSRSVQVIAPVMPFLADHFWRTLRGDEQADSVFLEPWPEHGPLDDQLLEEVTELDDELRQEGRVYDLTHQLNTRRKEAGLALTDRIRVVLPDSDADLLDYEERIKDEVLATEIDVGQVAEPQIEKI